MRLGAAIALGLLALTGAAPATGAAEQPDPSPLWAQYPLDPGPPSTALPPAPDARPDAAPATPVRPPVATPSPPASEPPATAPAAPTDPAPATGPATTIEPATSAASAITLAAATGSAATSGGSPWPLAWTLLALSVAAVGVQLAAGPVARRRQRRRDDAWLEREVERLSAPDRRAPTARRDGQPRT
jgi:hypothetical protein